LSPTKSALGLDLAKRFLAAKMAAQKVTLLLVGVLQEVEPLMKAAALKANL
jgi:hypothetical protein